MDEIFQLLFISQTSRNIFKMEKNDSLSSKVIKIKIPPYMLIS